VLHGAQQARHATCSVQFSTMSLTIVDAQRVTLELLLASDGERGSGIQTAGNQNDCFAHEKLERKVRRKDRS
jgi:hypothetical protein